MNKPRTIKTGVTIAIALFAAHFLMDIYKIGIKDGKATKAAIAKQQKLNK